MDGGAVLCELAANLTVHLGFVGHETGLTGDVAEHDRVNTLRLSVVDVEPTQLAAVAVNQRQNNPLVSGALLQGTTSLKADVGLFDLNRVPVQTKRHAQIARTQRFASTVLHEPSGLEGEIT